MFRWLPQQHSMNPSLCWQDPSEGSMVLFLLIWVCVECLRGRVFIIPTFHKEKCRCKWGAVKSKLHQLRDKRLFCEDFFGPRQGLLKSLSADIQYLIGKLPCWVSVSYPDSCCLPGFKSCDTRGSTTDAAPRDRTELSCAFITSLSDGTRNCCATHTHSCTGQYSFLATQE